MNFDEKLKYYINDLNISISKLSKVSGISESTLSRYKNGNRIPNNPSKELDKLIKGLSKLYNEKNINSANELTIREEFNKIIKTYNIDNIINNFNSLISILNINISDFSKTLGYDPSYLSRIRSKERKPSNPSILIEAITNYIIKNYNDKDSKLLISNLLDCDLKELSTNKYKEKLYNWLYSNNIINNKEDEINTFLTKLNDFNLDEYIKSINFDKLPVPTIPFKLPKSRTYYGIEEIKKGELDFFKSIILSKDTKNLFMCSDMQMDDMAKDIKFSKKWMISLAMILKKGIHINIIHNIDRPFNEMMLGLESWIPIYMTGLVSPYYLNNSLSDIYSHLNYISNNTILTGECIKGYHSKGKYYLTNNKIEVAYYQEKEKLLLKKAKPLMNIYTKKEEKLFNSFINNIDITNSTFKIINSSLPIYTINNKLLIEILKNNNLSQEDISKIISYVNKRKKDIKSLLKKNTIHEIISVIKKEEFEKYPLSLDLSNIFINKNIRYTYNDYLTHLKDTKKYASNNNYKLELQNELTFRNINIIINNNNFVIISKNNNPNIHFVIKHPKLCNAISNFTVPIKEQ